MITQKNLPKLRATISQQIGATFCVDSQDLIVNARNGL
jgi:hypothetical protein